MEFFLIEIETFISSFQCSLEGLIGALERGKAERGTEQIHLISVFVIFFEGTHDILDQSDHIVFIVGLADENKLITAITGDEWSERIIAAGRFDQRCSSDQCFITFDMTLDVIDRFEIIEVDHDHAVFLLVRISVLELLKNITVELTAVVQTCQWI